MAGSNYQFIFDEDQEMETQSTYLSIDESEIASANTQLPNNVPDT